MGIGLLYAGGMARTPPWAALAPPRDREAEADELRRHREAFGLSRAALARLLGVYEQTCYRWERALSPIPTMLLLLVRAWAREAGIDVSRKPKAKR